MVRFFLYPPIFVFFFKKFYLNKNEIERTAELSIAIVLPSI